MLWIYEGQPVHTAPDFAVAYVYAITNTISGRRYIGKKSLRRSKIKRKAGARNSKIITESNWRDYYGSNKQLLADVAYYGELNFTREILCWCKTKGDANYYELKYQILEQVLEKEEYYNVYIGSRIHANHLSVNKRPRT